MHASKSLEEAKKRNETADSRVIGIAIETRPDWINVEEITRLRRYGVTRVEIGYQTTIDAINDLNKFYSIEPHLTLGIDDNTSPPPKA